MNDKKENKTGRKSSWGKIQLAFPTIKERLTAGDPEWAVAKRIGVAYSTWNKYKVEKKELSELIKECRGNSVVNLVASMYDAANGGVKQVKKIMKLKTVTYDNGKKIKEEEHLEEYVEEIYIPPNITAGIFLLTNWDKKHYSRDPHAKDAKLRELKLKEEQMKEGEWK